MEWKQHWDTFTCVGRLICHVGRMSSLNKSIPIQTTVLTKISRTISVSAPDGLHKGYPVFKSYCTYPYKHVRFRVLHSHSVVLFVQKTYLEIGLADPVNSRLDLEANFSNMPWVTRPYSTGKSYGIFGKHNGNSRVWHFDLLEMAWHQPQTSIITFMQLPPVVLRVKNAIRNVLIQDTQKTVQECIFFDTSPKISDNLQSIHHVNLCKFCLHSPIPFLHHVKVSTGPWIIIWVLKQSGRKAWLKLQYLVILVS